MAAKRQRTNIPFAEVLELVLQDDGEELSDLEYGDLSEDEEALINEGVDPDLDLAEQRYFRFDRLIWNSKCKF